MSNPFPADTAEHVAWEAQEAGTDEGNPLLAELRNGAWLDRQVFPALRWTVPGIIPEGMVLLVGPPKAGKSWFVLAAAIAVASGGQHLGIRTGDPRPVLYLALEDGDRRLQERSRNLLGPDPIPGRLDYLTRVRPGQLIATVAAWLEMHGTKQPLVILDTLGKVTPDARPGESAYARDYRVGGALKRLADDYPGTTVLVNHHDRKAEGADFVDSVSGTHGLAGAADTIVVLARPRNEEDGVLKVTGRDVLENEYAVTFAQAQWTLNGDDLRQAAENAAAVRAATGLGDRSADVLEYVRKHPQGVRAGEVAMGLGVDAKTAGTYLARLHEAGRVKRPSRGLYTPVESVESVESDHGYNTLNTFNTPTEPGEDPPTLRALPPVDVLLCECGNQLLHPGSIKSGECERCRLDRL